jgi:hypothetical protein
MIHYVLFLIGASIVYCQYYRRALFVLSHRVYHSARRPNGSLTAYPPTNPSGRMAEFRLSASSSGFRVLSSSLSHWLRSPGWEECHRGVADWESVDWDRSARRKL